MTTEKNRVALVTGASKGIGAAIARELARDGFDIWLNYRGDHDSARAVAAEIEGAGVSCTLLPCDVADSAQVKEVLGPLLAETSPYVLVNNAGYARDGIMALMSDSDWNDVLDVHLGGFFNVTKLVLPGMMKRRQGRIVNIVSTSGQTGIGGQVNYSAAKSGLIGATRSLAMEVSKRKILVNAVAPGFIETEMTSDLPHKEQILATIPLGRMGTVEEVSAMVGFLCSERASYITGQVFSVNGGAYL